MDAPFTMKRILPVFVALAVVLAGCDTSSFTDSQAPAPQTAATNVPGNAQSSDNAAIPGQYIIVFNDNVRNAKGLAKRLANANSASVRATYEHSIKGFAAGNMSAQAAQALENNPSVKFVEQDQVLKLDPPCHVTGTCDGGGGGSTGETTPYGITRIGGAADGTGKTAWVIDSGIDLDHPDLNVDTQRSATFLDKGKGSKSADDGNGHGTHVAGTIAAINNSRGVVGVAAGASVVAVRVLDQRGSGSYSNVIEGIDYVAANASAGDVANMSLGGPTSDALDSAVRNAADQGIYFALAAGNSSEDANLSSPARVEYKNVWTVSAFDQSDAFASFSNFGNPPIEFGGPGVDILSTKVGGGTTTKSGTSMASPHVAGILLMTGGNPATDGTVSGDPDGDADPIATL